MDPDVLVVGAGPTGLALALEAAAHGARVRVVERRPPGPRPSRALIVHARTLEVLRPLGVTEALLARGAVAPSVRLHLGRREVDVRLGGFALADTAYPFLLLVPQAAVEEVLGEALAARDVAIEHGRTLTGLLPGQDKVVALLQGSEGDERVECRYLAGCDGSASALRRLAGIGWRGAAYRQEAVLADLELGGGLDPGAAHAVAGRGGVLFLFALGERATWRLLATRPATGAGVAGELGAPVPEVELQGLLDRSGLAAEIRRVAWSARVALEHRVADAYRRGPVFLAGDAAHVHSPAGGQGMNTGLQDAANLGWKLAVASAGGGGAGEEAPGELLLDSYEAERRPVALRGIALTHALFWAEAGTGWVSSQARGRLAPFVGPLVPLLLERPRLVARGVRLLSQLDLRYPPAPLVTMAGSSGPKPARWALPGTRLGDATVEVEGRPRRLHELLARPGLHVLLARRCSAPEEAVADRLVSVHRVTSWPGRAAVVVRPDGYVGWSCVEGDPAGIRRALSGLGLVLGRGPTTGARLAAGRP